MSEPRVLYTTCDKCKKRFYPYGHKPIIPPPYDEVECPHCGHKNPLVWDLQLGRELARKKLGLNKDLDNRVKQMEIENKELKIEIASLKKQVEENAESINKLKTILDSLFPFVRKQITDLFTQLKKELKKEAPFRV